jgi:hypothetical protein
MTITLMPSTAYGPELPVQERGPRGVVAKLPDAFADGGGDWPFSPLPGLCVLADRSGELPVAGWTVIRALVAALAVPILLMLLD